MLIGFWAIGYTGRSIALLMIWVGATALAKGFTQIVRGFALHGLKKDFAAVIGLRPPKAGARSSCGELHAGAAGPY